MKKKMMCVECEISIPEGTGFYLVPEGKMCMDCYDKKHGGKKVSLNIKDVFKDRKKVKTDDNVSKP
jgi:hypothetical protein